MWSWSGLLLDMGSGYGLEPGLSKAIVVLSNGGWVRIGQNNMVTTMAWPWVTNRFFFKIFVGRERENKEGGLDCWMGPRNSGGIRWSNLLKGWKWVGGRMGLVMRFLLEEKGTYFFWWSFARESGGSGWLTGILATQWRERGYSTDDPIYFDVNDVIEFSGDLYVPVLIGFHTNFCWNWKIPTFLCGVGWEECEKKIESNRLFRGTVRCPFL